MGNDLIGDLALEEVKEKLASIEGKQDVIIGHLEALEAMWGTEEVGMAGIASLMDSVTALDAQNVIDELAWPNLNLKAATDIGDGQRKISRSITTSWLISRPEKLRQRRHNGRA